MEVPLDPGFRVGFMGAMPSTAAVRATVALAERGGYDSLWVGDHVAFPLPVLDPFLQLAQAAAFSERLHFGTAVYLLPLRHPVLVAKQVATLDRLVAGRFVFGVGVGGEFPDEYRACGVPRGERGARLSEAILLLRKLWRGEAGVWKGRFFELPDLRLLPLPLQAGGPPIWCGGRSAAALARIGRIADGWVSYVVTPEAFARGLEAIARAAEGAGRRLERLGTAHLLFVRLDASFEDALDAAAAHLSQRYAMDFRRPAEKYAALGGAADVAARIDAFRRAGVRHLILDPVGPPEDRDGQLERFATEVRPLL